MKSPVETKKCGQPPYERGANHTLVDWISLRKRGLAKGNRGESADGGGHIGRDAAIRIVCPREAATRFSDQSGSSRLAVGNRSARVQHNHVVQFVRAKLQLVFASVEKFDQKSKGNKHGNFCPLRDIYVL